MLNGSLWKSGTSKSKRTEPDAAAASRASPRASDNGLAWQDRRGSAGGSRSAHALARFRLQVHRAASCFARRRSSLSHRRRDRRARPSPLGGSVRSRPRMSTPISTEAFGAVPFEGRCERMHREAADVQRALQRFGDFRRRRVLGRRLEGAWAASRRRSHAGRGWSGRAVWTSLRFGGTSRLSCRWAD